jgi:hypothetical protein
MKKVILATLMAGLVPMIVSAQGTINFQSASTAAYVTINAPGNPVGAGYIASLHGGASGANEGGLSQLGGTAAVTGGSGLIIGGGTRTNSAVAGGATGAFQVRAWTSASGATYDAAVASGSGFAGKTAVFEQPTGNPTATPPGTPAFLTGWNTPLIVTPIPEPATIALAGLGVASLLIFRRRK